jgi:uncharacterized phage protein (TIGR02218 family)
MRTLPPALAAKLHSGVTTLCWCWRVARQDGVVLGFTDHDRALVFDGVTYVRASALASGALESESGFAGGTTSIVGVLSDDAITSGDIDKGRYEGARVQLLRVDWTEPSSRVLIWTGVLGEIVRGELGFEVELRGLQSLLERGVGRIFSRRCDAELGDARCTVDLDHPDFRATAAVSATIDARAFRTGDLAAFDDGWFAGGVLTWTSGANTGARGEVEAHRGGDTLATLELLTAPASAVAPGDAFTVDAGCDKRWATCKAKFSNTANFRGFPMIPGDDWLQAGPRSGDRNDGGSLWTDRDA